MSSFVERCYVFVILIMLLLLKCFTLVLSQSHRECFDIYKVRLDSQEREPEVIGQIIPDVSSDGMLTLNVTTNSILSTNMHYHATLTTTMDMVEAGSFQFCKCSCHKLVLQ